MCSPPQRTPMKLRTVTVSALILISLLPLSCKKSSNRIPVSDISNMPSLTVKNDTTVYFDSGRVALKMTFPIMEQYDNSGSPYNEFNMGLYVDIFNSNSEPSGSITSKYARYTRNQNLWELRDSVVVINENYDKLETESLFWDQTKDLIYSDRFVKFTNKDQVIMGTGFESDSHLRQRKIKKVSATIFLNEEEPAEQP